jgi:predicted component of type VI protein secretion system
MSGVDASAYTSGKLWTGAKVIAYSNAGVAWRAAVRALTSGGNTWELVNVSYYRSAGGVQSYKVPPDVDIITGGKFHTRIDSQRRRLGKETS